MAGNPLLTTEEIRRINDYMPVLGGHTKQGVDFASVLTRIYSTTPGYGASLIGVEDANSYFTGTDLETVLNELYVAATTGGSDSITDAGTYYTTDTIDGAFDALSLQIGGLTDATFGFAESNVIPDNTAIYAALELLDLFVGDLAAVANGEGASLVGVEDSAGLLTATDVEAALEEIRTVLRTKAAEAVVIAAGVATVTQSSFTVDEETNPNADDLDTITGLVNGQFFVCMIADADAAITVKDATGNIKNPGGFDITLASAGDFVFGVFLGATARVLGFHTADLQAGGLGKALNSGASGFGASMVALEDATTYWTVDDMESAMDAIAAQIGGDTDAAFNFTSDFVLADNDSLYAALNKLDVAFGATLATLTTVAQTLVLAINEVDANADTGIADAATAQGAIDSHIDGAANKHDASEVDYERADGSKKVIQASSDTVDLALDDLDDALGPAETATPNGTGVAVTGTAVGAVKKVLVTLTNVDLPLVDSAGVVAYASLKILDLPAGHILFLGAVADLALTKSSAGVNDDWDGDIALGSEAADNGAALATTEQDFIPTTATPQAVAGVTTGDMASTSTESGVVFDGSGTAVDVYLNALVDDADHDVTGTPCNLIVNGTILLTFINLGDN